jgi:hypothetical protein
MLHASPSSRQSRHRSSKTEESPKCRDLPATAELLDEIRGFIVRFVVLPSDAAADLLAVWVLHTHAFEAFWATPYLRVTSATPESAKTLLLEVLASITRRGWHEVNPSTAVLYRKIDRQQPTSLLDEMDYYPLDDRRDALSVLNAGYKRGATVSRCKDNGDLEEFNCFCPKGYTGLDVGTIAPTFLSRSITVRLERKTAEEKVDMWIAPRVQPAAAELRECCEGWAAQHVEVLDGHEPDLLGLINRAAEVWWALLSIAELAGEEWHACARAAVKEPASGGDDTDSQPDQVQLLADIRDAFSDEMTISTASLLAYLNDLDESPWGARRRGEGLDARGLAKMLRPFKIKSRTVRTGEGAAGTARGYRLEQFEDAFARHLPEATQATQATQPRISTRAGCVGCVGCVGYRGAVRATATTRWSSPWRVDGAPRPGHRPESRRDPGTAGWDREEGEQETKGRSRRTVPMTGELRTILAAHRLRTGRRGRDLVFGATEAWPSALGASRTVPTRHGGRQGSSGSPCTCAATRSRRSRLRRG